MSPFVSVEHVSKRFVPRLSVGERIAAALGSDSDTRTVHAVDDVSLHVGKGEVLGLVGESGCGKSTLGRIIAGIWPPTAGAATIADEHIMDGTRKATKVTTRVQMVFQDPFASLNPRLRIGDTIADGPIASGLVRKAEARDYGCQLRSRHLEFGLLGRYPANSLEGDYFALPNEHHHRRRWPLAGGDRQTS